MADEGKYGGMSSDEFKKLGEDAISLQTSLNSISSLLKLLTVMNLHSPII